MKKRIIAIVMIVSGVVSVYTVKAAAYSGSDIEFNRQEEYTEISPETVPEKVFTAVTKAYPSAKLVRAFVNEKKEYKLILEEGDQKVIVYIDEQGNWIKI